MQPSVKKVSSSFLHTIFKNRFFCKFYPSSHSPSDGFFGQKRIQIGSPSGRSDADLGGGPLESAAPALENDRPLSFVLRKLATQLVCLALLGFAVLALQEGGDGVCDFLFIPTQEVEMFIACCVEP